MNPPPPQPCPCLFSHRYSTFQCTYVRTLTVSVFQNVPSQYNEEHDSSSDKLLGCDSEIYHNCDNHSLHDPFWYNHDTPPPETASSIQSLLLNGNSAEETHCKDHACCTEWEDDDDREHEGHEGCQEHRGPLSPSIMIPGMMISVKF